MERVDMKKLETAIVYLQRLADGKNPVNNVVVDEDSVINNPNVIRCMFFVKEILEEVKKQQGYVGKRAKKNEKLDFPIDVLALFNYEEDKSISKLVAQLNDLIDVEVYKKLSYKMIIQWLKENGFLQEIFSQEMNKTITMPTEIGINIGIRTENRTSMRGGEYILIIYDKKAQEYIVHNMEKILHDSVE